jgi:hypothetical protein
MAKDFRHYSHQTHPKPGELWVWGGVGGVRIEDLGVVREGGCELLTGTPRDLRRICEHPTEEDRRWFPDIAGAEWLKTLDFAMRNFKDESFIQQFLSPQVIRDFRLFSLIFIS